MTIERLSITDRAEWLRWRQHDVTASVAAALLDAHERVTRLELWLDKRGIVPLGDGEETAPMRRGRLLEPLAIEVLKEQHPDWTVVSPELYLRDPDLRLAATPDTLVHDSLRRLGVIEVKSVEPSVFRRTWVQEDGSIEPPLAAAVQAVVCKRLADAEWCSVAVLRVGHGIELTLLPIEEPPGLWERLIEACGEFWRSVEKREQPEPNFAHPADVALILQLARGVADEGGVLDVPAEDNYLPSIVSEHVALSAEIKERAERQKAIKAEILHRLGTASVMMRQGKILATAKTVKKKAYSVAASSYRDLRCKGISP